MTFGGFVIKFIKNDNVYKGLKIVYLNKNIDSLLDKYNFDYLLVSTDYPIYVYLKDNKNYIPLFINKKYVIYKKN